MDEIKDTDVDREALRVLLTRFRDAGGIDTAAAGLAHLNETWARMAQVMAGWPDDQFNTFQTWLDDQRQGFEVELAEISTQGRRWPERELRIGGLKRAQELLGLIVEWRAETWAAAETAAGRDPYVVDKAGWKPPHGWMPPAKGNR